MKSKKYSLGLLLWLAVCWVPASAQIEVVSGTTLTFVAGTKVDVTGNFINNGTINGKGTLNTTGNFTNNGAFAITIGPTAVTHTTLAVGGTVSITSGAFSVTTDGYSPSSGDQATIITSSLLSGTFTNSGNNDWNANYDQPNAGDFTITYQTSLPVELNLFSARFIKDKVLLSWETASEINNNGFDIQRSSDGLDWQELAFVPGHGTTHEEQSYSYTDQRPLPGLNYYRLKQMDFDGQFEYSKVVSVDFRNLQDFGNLSLFPNPAAESVILTLNTDYFGEATLTLYGLMGSQMKTQTLSLEGGAFRMDLGLAGLPAGIYLAKVQAGREQWMERLVVE